MPKVLKLKKKRENLQWSSFYQRCFPSVVWYCSTSHFVLRYKLAFSQSRIASYLFDGTGYALINNIERKGKFGTVTRFDIAVRTVANSGIIFLMVNGVRPIIHSTAELLFFFKIWLSITKRWKCSNCIWIFLVFVIAALLHPSFYSFLCKSLKNVLYNRLKKYFLFVFYRINSSFWR